MSSSHSSLESEMREISLFLSVMRQQLAGTLENLETGVLSVIERLQDIESIAQKQQRSLDLLRTLGDALPEPVLRALDNVDMDIKLSEALGLIQFQDVVRQRVEHVQRGLQELDEHIQFLAQLTYDPNWDGIVPLSLKEKLREHAEHYVMAEQRAAHHQVIGDLGDDESDCPAIELF